MMESFKPSELNQLYIPPQNSHKGQNGKVMIIGGSHLFHAASLWALSIASRVVDMVFYASVPENNLIVEELKKEFRNGIIVRRDDIEAYIEEAESVLIGPGMLRSESKSAKLPVGSLEEINTIEDEGLQSYYLTKYLLHKYPHKKWIIDAGALQMMEKEWFLQLDGNVVITPHALEFERVFGKKPTPKVISDTAKKYNVIILWKGQTDIVCSPEKCVEISGGNAGMTKGGTGDVLAGLVASLASKNDLYLAATAGSYFNKKAGEALFETVGYYFNASELAEEIPKVMRKELGLINPQLES